MRDAAPTDAPAIRALLQSNALSDDAVSSQQVSHMVAQNRGEIIGVAALERHGPFGLLRSVAVTPSWRHQGVASALVNEIARKFGDLCALYLFTDTAERLFASLGFEVVPRDTLPADIANTSQALVTCPATALAMRREVASQQQPDAREDDRQMPGATTSMR